MIALKCRKKNNCNLKTYNTEKNVLKSKYELKPFVDKKRDREFMARQATLKEVF